MESPSPKIAAAAISGIRWNYLGTISSTICNLAIGIVLARILGPKPYGQVIIAMIIYGFINLFVDGGFSQALIQKPSIDAVDIRKTFTCQVSLGLLTSALMYIFASWIAARFHDPDAVHVVQAMSLMITIQALGLVSGALLRRDMRFKVVQAARVSSYLFGFLIIGIPSAMYGAGVWSLVLAYLAQCLLNALLLYWAARHPVLPIFRLPDRSITSYGGTIVGNNVVNWVHSNIDNVAVSHLGPVALGLYGRACTFAYTPVNALVTAMQTVLLSSTARVQERQRLIRDLTLCLVGLSAGVLGAAYVTFALIPGTTIVGLYGDKWVGVIPLMVPFAIAMPLYGIHCLFGPILCGLGRPELEFWPQAISAGAAALAYFVAAQYSLASVAWALLAVMILRFALIAGFTFRLLDISWKTVGLVLARRSVFSAAFGGLIWLANHFLKLLPITAGPRLTILVVLASAMFGWAVWSAGHILFGRQAVDFLLNYASHLPRRYVERLRLQAGIAVHVETAG